MKKLAELQNDFISAIYDSNNQEILAEIKEGKIDKTEIFDIYRRNILSNLISALRITYNLIYKKIGEKKFTKIAKDFILSNPSSSGNLDDYHPEFSSFLKSSDLQNNDFLSELAAFEWLLHLSYLAANGSGINVENLQKLPGEKLFGVKFKLHPSCFMIKANHDLISIHAGNNKKIKKQINILINRDSGEVRAEAISNQELSFLKAISEGKTLYEIYENYQIDIQTCLQKFIGNCVLDEFYF